MSERIYCAYTDRWIHEREASSEHIVPISLGGIDGFEIQVDRRHNSRVGSEIDGALANDMLMMFERARRVSRGHSGRRPIPIARRSRIEALNLPVKAHFDPSGIRLFSPRDQRFLSQDESAGHQVASTFSIHRDTRIRFVAKVALGAGYFAYRDRFLASVNHDELRFLMYLDRTTVDPFRAHRARIRVTDELMLPASIEERLLRLMCSTFGDCVVALVPSLGKLTAAVGCLGRFLGLTVVPAEATKLLGEDVDDRGHVLCVQSQRLVRISFVDALLLVRDRLNRGLVSPPGGERASA